MQHLEDSVVDIYAWGPCSPTFLIDDTVRHPDPESRGTRNSSQEPGLAASLGDQEKQSRYPPKGGLSVTPASIETWGRLSPIFEGTLRKFAILAADHARLRGLPRTRPLTR